MKRMRTGLLQALAVLAMFSGPVRGAGEEEKAIRETIQLYFRGDIERDPALLRQAFHSTARLLTADDAGHLQALTQSEWYARIGETPARERPSAKILYIHQAGNVASAKTQLVFSKGSFTDFLSLVKIEGRWTIVNKVYHWQAR